VVCCGNAIGAYSIDRWGAVRTIVPCVDHGWAGVSYALAGGYFVSYRAVAIAMWSIAGTNDIACQQHRLIALSPEGPGVVLSLNSSAIYLGSAGGAALGGLMLPFHGQSIPSATYQLSVVSGVKRSIRPPRAAPPAEPR